MLAALLYAVELSLAWTSEVSITDEALSEFTAILTMFGIEAPAVVVLGNRLSVMGMVGPALLTGPFSYITIVLNALPKLNLPSEYCMSSFSFDLVEDYDEVANTA